MSNRDYDGTIFLFVILLAALLLFLGACSPTPNEALGQSHCKRDCIDTPEEKPFKCSWSQYEAGECEPRTETKEEMLDAYRKRK